MHTHVGQHDRIWGASKQGVEETAREWETNWADARALLSISMVMRVRILVTSSVDSILEAVPPDGTLGGTKPTWALRYRKDHCEAMRAPPREQLEAFFQAIQLEPWIHARAQGHGKGGAILPGRPETMSREGPHVC